LLTFTCIFSLSSGGSVGKPAGPVTLDYVRALARRVLGTTGKKIYET